QVAILGRLLVGLCAARSLALTDLGRHARLFRRVLVASAIVGLGGNILTALGGLDSPARGGFLVAFGSRVVEECGYLGLSLAYAAALAILFQSPRWARPLRLLAPVGRMALTCYLCQTLFGLWLFYGFMPGPGWMGRVGPVWLPPIWLAEYVVQMWIASAWLRRFRFGPAEWLWRSLTYGKIQPWRC
ncbi:MAG TPA: DUF418 domain-containing protein, partial [Verrucomicrobiae bacterium]|nr:DUF418 domain-containing protein [Verrucomicrobiae bacterium]